jgi:hypothetical protein
MTSFEDPSVPPPATLSDAEARRYEEKIAELIEAALASLTDRTQVAVGLELRGQRPETEIVFRLGNPHGGGDRVARFAVWKDIDRELDLLPDPASTAGWIYSDLLAGELDVADEDRQRHA